jgi:hypothetical protein
MYSFISIGFGFHKTLGGKMPLSPGHSDEVRDKNIKEMIAAGHEPKQAVAAAYAQQRKYRKMALGGYVADEDEEKARVEDNMAEENERSAFEGLSQEQKDLSDPHTGLFEMMNDSHVDNSLSEDPAHHQSLAKALGGKDDSSNGNVDSDIDPEETTALPESYFAEEAKRQLEAKKKKKAIIP